MSNYESSIIKDEADNLAKDLLGIVSDMLDNPQIATENSKRVLLIQALCIYIVERDLKVLQQGINVGEKIYRSSIS